MIINRFNKYLPSCKNIHIPTSIEVKREEDVAGRKHSWCRRCNIQYHLPFCKFVSSRFVAVVVVSIIFTSSSSLKTSEHVSCLLFIIIPILNEFCKTLCIQYLLSFCKYVLLTRFFFKSILL